MSSTKEVKLNIKYKNDENKISNNDYNDNMNIDDEIKMDNDIKSTEESIKFVFDNSDIHNVYNINKCESCNKQFKNINQLKRHCKEYQLESSHIAKSFKCIVNNCNKYFNNEIS